MESRNVSHLPYIYVLQQRLPECSPRMPPLLQTWLPGVAAETFIFPSCNCSARGAFRLQDLCLVPLSSVQVQCRRASPSQGQDTGEEGGPGGGEAFRPCPVVGKGTEVNQCGMLQAR